MPKSDTPHLWKRPGSSLWQARVRVPPGAGLKQTHIVRSLRTRDRSEALKRLPIVVGEIKLEIETARRKPNGTPKAAPPDCSEVDLKAALWWREKIAASGGDPDAEIIPDELDRDWQDELEQRYGDPIGERMAPGGARELEYDEARELRGDAFRAMVAGAIPVNAELERYLAEKPLTPSYESRIRLAVRRLEAWLKERPEGNSTKAITRWLASRFVDSLAESDLTTETVNSHVSALSAYWRWMERRGSASANPWAEQQRSRKDASRNSRKRPFTDEEIQALFSGETYRTLHDLMRLSALSGMRLNEITHLTVADAAGDEFNVRTSKTAAGVRRVPIHPLLKPLVERRSAGKDPSAYLLEELGASPSRQGRRGAKAGERFTAYRRDLGLDKRQEGRRQADADFHSFRRWFITKLEQADVAPQLIAALVGHEEGRDFLALLRYSAGPSKEQLSNAVALVTLPKDTPADSPAGALMGKPRG